MNENSAPRDHADEREGERDGSVERNIKARSTWLRLFFMLVVILLYGVSRVVVAAVVLIQFFTLLFRGRTNHALKELGQSLATYTYQIIQYLTFNTEQRPYPFDQSWPRDKPDFRDAETDDPTSDL